MKSSYRTADNDCASSSSTAGSDLTNVSANDDDVSNSHEEVELDVPDYVPETLLPCVERTRSNSTFDDVAL